MLLRMKIRILPPKTNPSLFSPDSNWYISVVLLYVIAACVRSNKRYSNPLDLYHTEFLPIHVPIFLLQGKVCNCDVSSIDCSVGLGTR